jgi:hypothetical protein
MTVDKIINDLGIIDVDTIISIRDEDFHLIAHGNRYHDDVLRYIDSRVSSYTWQDDNKVFIDIKLINVNR